MKTEIKKHTPVDGDFYLISIEGDLYAKAYSNEDAKVIAESKNMLELLKYLYSRGGLGLDVHREIKKILDKV